MAGAFLQAPYLRDILVSVGVMAETFETATTWDRLDGLISDVRDAAQSAVIEVCGRPGRVTCRLTHVYTDGAAPYFTVLAPVARGERDRRLGRHQGQGQRCATRRRRHHHTPSRCRPRPHAVVRPATPRAVRRCPARSEERRRPAGLLNPGVLVGLNHRRAAD